MLNKQQFYLFDQIQTNQTGYKEVFSVSQLDLYNNCIHILFIGNTVHFNCLNKHNAQVNWRRLSSSNLVKE